MNKFNTYKLVIIGESSVGKTSIISAKINNKFVPYTNTTIGAAFSKIVHESGIIFNTWDTAGQERYHSLIPMYYKNAEIIFLVFSIDNHNSFIATKKWINELRNYRQDVAIILIGNKADLEENRDVPIKEATEFAQYANIEYFETSAKNMQNINEIFDYVSLNLPPKLITEFDSINISENNDNYLNCCYL